MADRQSARRAPEKAADAELVEDVTLTLLRVMNKIQHGRRAAFAFSGVSLTLVEAEMCTLIGRNPGITGVELSSLLAVTRSATSQTVRKLKEKGYIRVAGDDGNAKLKRLYLTDRATAAVGVAERYSDLMKEAVFDMSHAELESCRKFLDRLESFHDRVSRTRNL